MPYAPDRLPRRLQELPPRQARFCLEIEAFFREIAPPDLAPGATLTVAFSHGADSTALLLALACLAPRLRVSLAACHLDHGLRASSAAEAERAGAFCRDMGIAFYGERVDVAALAKARGAGLEEAGRLARYAFFERVRGRTGAALTCLGHHLDDLCEDVILRLVRGAGWPALGGMPAADPERALVRPLLMTPRARIEEFLRELRASWIEDPSNAGRDYRRNRIRGDVLPRLTEENPGFGRAVARLWRLARLDAEYFDGLTASHLPPLTQDGPAARPGAIVVGASELAGAHPALRLRLLKAALDRLGPGESRADSLFDLADAWARGRMGGMFRFPGGKLARVAPGGVECLRVAGARRAGGAKKRPGG
ncbi:MAG: tRNA lysidine(34) synthetase TilS [Desulfovibrionaceae bacterium]|nr:tRNA lysidine(34) synthetase TilS [Desulfovibrionaceae bacterium]MBF0513921.1 tRNA lysidine(34) synthetase TilS [Desulfovibrionaceae bacterium]